MELEQLKKAKTNQTREIERLQTSMESQQREMTKEQVSELKLVISYIKMYLFLQTELKVKMSSLQSQLLSAKRNLSTTEESSSRDKSVLQSKLTEAQQHLKEAKAENEIKKVHSQ